MKSRWVKRFSAEVNLMAEAAAGGFNVPELEAKHQIVYGFFQEVLDQISFEELRDELSAAARAKVR